MDALVYIRWSSQQQSKGDSHARQSRLAAEVALAKGYSIRETLIEDGNSPMLKW